MFQPFVPIRIALLLLHTPSIKHYIFVVCRGQGRSNVPLETFLMCQTWRVPDVDSARQERSVKGIFVYCFTYVVTTVLVLLLLLFNFLYAVFYWYYRMHVFYERRHYLLNMLWTEIRPKT